MIGSSIITFPNIYYICYNCGKNLGNKYDRLKHNKQPNVNIIDGKCYCDKCANNYWQKGVRHVKQKQNLSGGL